MAKDPGRNSSWLALMPVEERKSSSLTDADVVQIRHRYRQGNITQRKLADEFNIPPGSIHDVLRGNSLKYQHLDVCDTGPRTYAKGEDTSQAILNNEDVLTIRSDAKKGVRQKILSDRYGVTQATICAIVKRRSWKHL